MQVNSLETGHTTTFEQRLALLETTVTSHKQHLYGLSLHQGDFD